MRGGVSVTTFLRRYNRAGRYELVFGKIRPTVQVSERNAALVQRLRRALESHLMAEGHGKVLADRIDVILDRNHEVVLHPPLAVLLGQNMSRVRTRTQVWGAPDIVLEVLTRATARRIRHTRLRWYREWGVRECWLLDTRSNRFEVLGQMQDVAHVFSGEQSIVSSALPEFRPSANSLFIDRSTSCGTETT
jgi:Uma2 family endonuclease